ncbi:hypothetical protein [Streptomyces sp. NPDC127098]|uniref:hypothetical protein n=1 Tax=Streptomyces sp. NPDC127098 TaxID=3347137 RepID=UPI003664E2DD
MTEHGDMPSPQPSSAPLDPAAPVQTSPSIPTGQPDVTVIVPDQPPLLTAPAAAALLELLRRVDRTSATRLTEEVGDSAQSDIEERRSA